MNFLSLFSQYKGLRKEVYILFFGKIVTKFGALVWPVLTLILSQKMGYDATTVALVMGVAGFLQLPLGLLGGKLADIYSKRMIIVICDLVSIFFYIVCAFLPLTRFSIAGIIIASTFQHMEAPAYLALLADLSAVKDRERAYSLIYLGANIGMVISPAIAGFLFTNHLWLIFLISGIAISFSTVLIFFAIKETAPVEAVDNASYQTADRKVSILSVLKENKPVFLFIIIMALYHAAYMQYTYLMPLDMAKVHGDAGALLYGSVSSMNCTIVVIFTPLITALFVRRPYTQKTTIGAFMVLLGYIVFLLGLGHIPVYYLAILLFTWGEVFSTIANGPYLTERIPASHRGRINGVQNALQALAGNGVLYFVGVLYDGFGSSVAWIFVIALVSVILTLCFILQKMDRRRYHFGV